MKEQKGPLTGKALVAGVMGWPVSHTLSPKLHGYWLRLYGIDGTYIPMPVPPERLEEAVRALTAFGFRGCNLTIPHKEKALAFVDDLDPQAAKIGAVNTLEVLANGRIRGSNTDVFGFAENLKEAGFSLSASRPIAALWGAGGAGRAVLAALQSMGFQDIRLINRNRARAEKLAEDLSDFGTVRIFAEKEAPRALEEASLFINATSLGMKGNPPLPVDLFPLAPDAWVTDVVYAPLETPLLKQARERGLKSVDGLGMLLHQARAGFAAWFGKDPEVTPALRAFVLGQA